MLVKIFRARDTNEELTKLFGIDLIEFILRSQGSNQPGSKRQSKPPQLIATFSQPSGDGEEATGKHQRILLGAQAKSPMSQGFDRMSA